MSKDNNKNIIYYPTCNYKKCNGLLNLTINPNNFSISYNCQNNKNHDRSCIYFKTFEKYYLEKEENFTCINCSNIEKNQIFQCLDCEKMHSNSNFCTFCLFKDCEKNNHKNFISYNKYKCKIHHMDFSDYCKNCKKNICIKCYENENHVDHDTFNYTKNIFNEHEIFELEKQINEKSEKTSNLIEKIKEWFREIKRKTDELIQNLKDEIDLYKAILLNYNKNILNYKYVNNFILFKNFFQNSMYKNENLSIFEKKMDFKERSIALINAFINLGNKSETNYIDSFKGNLTKINNNGYKIIKSLNDEISFCQNQSNWIYLIYNSGDSMRYYSNSKIDFIDEIKSVTLISKLNLLLICVANSKKVRFINYDLNKKILINSRELIDNTLDNTLNNFFNKCIMLSEKLYVTADACYIKIWKEDEDNKNILIFNTKKINADTCDLLLINDGNFISCQYNIKTLTIFDSNLKEIKKITNIDCINSNNCLFKIQEKYIVIQCLKGLCLFLIDTKEIIQYFVVNTEKICFDEINCFYTFEVSNVSGGSIFSNLETKVRLIRIKFEKGTFEVEKEDKEYKIEYKIKDIIYPNDKKIYLNGTNLYIWERSKE